MDKFNWHNWIKDSSAKVPRRMLDYFVNARRCLSLLRALSIEGVLDEGEVPAWIGSSDGAHRVWYLDFITLVYVSGRLPKDIIVVGIGNSWAYRVEWRDVKDEDWNIASEVEYLTVLPSCALIPCDPPVPPMALDERYTGEGGEWFIDSGTETIGALDEKEADN